MAAGSASDEEQQRLIRSGEGGGEGYATLSMATVVSLKGKLHQRLARIRRSRVFVDPAPPLLASLDEAEAPGVAEHSEFRYLMGHRTRGMCERLLAEGVQGVESKRWLIVLLILIATVADGLRPISLIYAKGDNREYPFMFSTWVVLVKIMVLVFSIIMLFVSHNAPVVPLEEGEHPLPHLPFRRKFALSFYLLPSTLCYLASDIMNFFLFTRISATAYSVVKQSRIVITAILFRFVLKRSVSLIQWLAVFQLALASTLFVAVDMMMNSSTDAACPEEDSSSPLTKADIIAQNAAFISGILLLLLKCFIDSLAVVWMDFYFKELDGDGFPYAEQQLAVALQSLLGGLVYFFAVDFEGSNRGIFDGYNTAAWASAFLAAFYGILVSLILRWTDSMVKMVQALVSVALTILLDHLCFGERIGELKAIAIVFIMINVFLYKAGTVKEISK